MALIFTFLIVGMVSGYFYKNDKKLHYYADKIAVMSVYVLLIFMGCSTAQMDDFLEIFTDSGRIAIFLATFGMLGSILLTLPVYLYLKSHKSLFWSFFQKTMKTNENNPQPPQHCYISDSNGAKEKKTAHPVMELKTNQDTQKQDKKKAFKVSFILPLVFYFLGVLLGFSVFKSHSGSFDELVLYTLYVLLFFIGITIGKLNVVELLKRYHVFILLIPFLALLGSLLGGLFVNQVFAFSKLRECLSINAGMGYYSISAIINKSFLGDKVGLIALFTNLIRETFTMLCCYHLVKIFGPLAPISTGGATTMDTTLPFIRQNTSPEYALIAFINGIVLTIVVPPLTSFIATC